MSEIYFTDFGTTTEMARAANGVQDKFEKIGKAKHKGKHAYTLKA
jgi:hypothetical protein